MQDLTKAPRGRLLQSDGPDFGGRVFYVVNNTRHWVTSAEWCAENGFIWPDDVVKVDDADLHPISLGRPAARKWNVDKSANMRVTDQWHMREIGASFLRGKGIEFGAASNPLPIPLDCQVDYADLLTHKELLEQLYPGQVAANMIMPSISARIDDLSKIEKPLDFIASAHVIEHVRDPIGTIIRAAAKLNSGGQMLFLVPDMTQTFDSARELTSLEHLVLDFYDPNDEKDQVHFQEFYDVAFATPAEHYEETWSKAWEERFPIHYHTWTYESFTGMVEWILKTSRTFTSYWSHPTLGNEFCFVLQK